MNIGADCLPDDRCAFAVWAPDALEVAVHVTSPVDCLFPLKQEENYWVGVVDGITSGARYFINLNGEVDRPDPASRFQPEGVHGPSEVIDHLGFGWTDDGWSGIALSEMIIY